MVGGYFLCFFLRALFGGGCWDSCLVRALYLSVILFARQACRCVMQRDSRSPELHIYYTFSDISSLGATQSQPTYKVQRVHKRSRVVTVKPVNARAETFKPQSAMA